MMVMSARLVEMPLTMVVVVPVIMLARAPLCMIALVVMAVFPVVVIVNQGVFMSMIMRVILVIVGMAMVMVMIAFTFMTVVMMIVVAFIPVRVVMGAAPDRPVSIDQVEGSQQCHADAGEKRVNPEARVEMLFHPPRDVEVKKHQAPGEQGSDREKLQEFFHRSVGGGLQANPDVAQNADGDEDEQGEQGDEA